MSYKLGFLKLRFSVEEGSKKEKIIKYLIKTENNIKRFFAKSLKRKKHSVVINNQQFYFYDIIFSLGYTGVIKDMEDDCYGLSKIDFKENDIVIDIGANIGMISIYLAKKYPFLKIYAFEPFKASYDSFIKSIKSNNIPNGTIHAFNKAVTKDGRNIFMETVDLLNSVSFSVALKKGESKEHKKVSSTTLDNIIETALAENKQDRIKLLKMDCELSEYEILKNTKIENLKKISYLSAEFHEKEGFGNPEELETYIKQYIPNVRIVKCKLD